MSRLLPSPDHPMEVARILVDELYRRKGLLTIRFWRGGWWRWERSHWLEIETAVVRGDAYVFTEHATFLDEKGRERKWAPTRMKIANLLEAVTVICLVEQTVDQPIWLNDEQHGVIVACANGLLDLSESELLPHTPAYFNQTAVPFDYDADASRPTEWLRFLRTLWEGEEGKRQIYALQEFFGYVISGRLDMQKILLLVGPTRAGKGVIARTLGHLVGSKNVAGLTLSSLKGEFGLMPLIGKPLAVVSDARLSGRDASVVVERLLSISGEDTLTINRKYKDHWTGKLPTRLFVASNELPRLGDSSAAIAGRFLTLQLRHSFMGKEDRELENRIRGELSGILNWALTGLERLERRGKFTHAAAMDDAFEQLQALASPISVFIAERCKIRGDYTVSVEELWQQWGWWCARNGHHVGNRQNFGRELHSRVPGLRVVQETDATGKKRHRVYVGIRLTHKKAGGNAV